DSGQSPGPSGPRRGGDPERAEPRVLAGDGCERGGGRPGVAEDAADRPQLRGILRRIAGRAAVDPADVAGREPRRFEGRRNGRGAGAAPPGRAADLAEGARPPRGRRLERLEHEDGRALPAHGPARVLVERPAALLAAAARRDRGEPRQQREHERAQLVDAARKHRGRPTAGDQRRPPPHRQLPGHPARVDRDGRAVETERDRAGRRHRVHHRVREGERGEPARPAPEVTRRELLRRAQIAELGADDQVRAAEGADAGHDDTARHDPPAHLVNASVTFWPPNPNEFEIAACTGAGRGTRGTQSNGTSGSTLVRLTVAGTTPWVSVSTVAAASRPPAAAIVWPICDLFELTSRRPSPNTRASARASIRSFCGVPVPCAFA